MTTDTHHLPTGAARTTATEIVKVPFHGTFIHTALDDGKPVVVAKPSIQSMGVDPKGQIDKLKTRSWAVTGLCSLTGSDGKTYQMVTVDLNTWAMLLANLNENRVDPAVRPMVIAFQRESADVLRQYWAKGMAPINPRLEPEQVPAVINEALSGYRSARERLIAEDEAERIALARVSVVQTRLLEIAVSGGLIDVQWGKTKAQVIVARGLGETPVIAREDLPLYVQDFVKSKGASQKFVRNYSSSIGRRLVAQAVLDGGPVPGKRLQELADGSVREVTAWTREHLPLFERVWEKYYANDPRVFE